MCLKLIDWIIIISYFLLSLFIGLIFKKRAEKGLEDYFLGSRKFPWYLAGISMVATTFGADTPLAVTEMVVKNGISGNWLWWNFLIGGMLTTFFFSHLWRRANVLTELELIELRYSGKAAAILRSVKSIYLGLIMNVLIMGWVNLAMISILKIFFGLDNITLFIAITCLMLVSVLYSALSGLWGVAVTDFIQFIIAMTGSIVLAFIVLNDQKIGGISGLISKLPSSSLSFFPVISNKGNIENTLSITTGTFFAYIGIQWWASWYPGAEPGGGGYIAQRMMSTKNEKESQWATLLFQIMHYTVRPWPWIIVALCTIILYPSLQDAKDGYVLAMKDFLPSGLQGLLIVAFFAAYMSTISTQINLGASFLVNDFYKRFIVTNKENAEKHYIRAGKFFSLLLMIISLLITSKINSISEVWKFIIECGAGLGLVLILRWYWWRINAWSEISASLLPFIGYFISKYIFLWEFPDTFFFTVTFTIIACLIITFLTKPEKEKTLIKFCQQINPPGIWKNYSNNTNNKEILILAIKWILSIIIAYSILFSLGYLIFQQYNNFLYYLIAIFIALFLFISICKISNQ